MDRKLHILTDDSKDSISTVCTKHNECNVQIAAYYKNDVNKDYWENTTTNWYIKYSLK